MFIGCCANLSTCVQCKLVTPGKLHLIVLWFPSVLEPVSSYLPGPYTGVGALLWAMVSPLCCGTPVLVFPNLHHPTIFLMVTVETVLAVAFVGSTGSLVGDTSLQKLSTNPRVSSQVSEFTAVCSVSQRLGWLPLLDNHFIDRILRVPAVGCWRGRKHSSCFWGGSLCLCSTN